MQMQSKMSSTSIATSSPVTRSNILALYHVLWQQQDQSVVRRGLKCNVVGLEDCDRTHPFVFDAIDLSKHTGVKLPNGETSMIIRSEYELFYKKFSKIERNFMVHGSAGIGKTHFLAYVLVMRLLARQPVTYQIDEPNSRVLCFTADGFFALPEENSEYHPLFQREDVWHLIDSTHGGPITHPNTDHTRALMLSTCSKAIFTTFWPDRLGFDFEWLPGCDFVLERWLKPCAWDEIFAMSALAGDQHDSASLRWMYIHFGSNARVCLQVANHLSRAGHYVHKQEHAHSNFWSLDPDLRELAAQYSRNLFAIQPGETRTEPLPYPVSQVASRLLADGIAASNSSGAKEAVNNLLNSGDAKDAGETFYRHVVVALMSRYGGTFELRCPDSEGHSKPAHEDFVLHAKFNPELKEQRVMPSTYQTQSKLATLAANFPHILHCPENALVHPGIDAIVFDASTWTVCLLQVTYGSPRPISPHGLLFLLNAVRGSSYEPAPLHPWKLIFATRGQVTTNSFQLNGSKKVQYFSSMFWDPRIQPYVMQLRDTDGDVNSSSSTYEQWGFPCKFPRKSTTSLPRRLANSLAHLVHRRANESECAEQETVKLWSIIIRTSGIPGAQLLGDMTSEQPVGPNGFHMKIPMGHIADVEE